MNDQNTPIVPGLCQLPTTSLRVETHVLDPQGREHHSVKIDWANLNERWALMWRIEDVLRQGYAIGMQRVDPKAERLANRYPPHG